MNQIEHPLALLYGAPMSIHAARYTANGPYRWLQIQLEPEGRWLDVVDTKHVILAQGFVSMEDQDEGESLAILSDPKDMDSEPLAVDGVKWFPQAAALLITQPEDPPRVLKVPTMEEAEAVLKKYTAENTF